MAQKRSVYSLHSPNHGGVTLKELLGLRGGDLTKEIQRLE